MRGADASTLPSISMPPWAGGETFRAGPLAVPGALQAPVDPCGLFPNTGPHPASGTGPESQPHPRRQWHLHQLFRLSATQEETDEEEDGKGWRSWARRSPARHREVNRSSARPPTCPPAAAQVHRGSARYRPSAPQCAAEPRSCGPDTADRRSGRESAVGGSSLPK